MVDINSEAMIVALALMFVLLSWNRIRPTLIKRLIAAISCAAVVALSLSNLFLHMPIMMPITQGQRLLLGGGASALLFTAIACNMKLGLFARQHQN